MRNETENINALLIEILTGHFFLTEQVIIDLRYNLWHLSKHS